MTKDEAKRVAAEITRQIADQTGYGSAVWDGCFVAIGIDDEGMDDPAQAPDWYVRIDKIADDDQDLADEKAQERRWRVE